MIWPPIIAILRGVTPSEVADIGHALVNAGIRALEVPLNSPSPFDSIARLVDAVAANGLQPVIDRSFRFDEAPAAYAYLKSGAHVGKVIISVP